MEAKKYLFIVALSFFLSGITYGQIISTIAGNGVAAYSGDGGPATAAGLNPSYIIFDASGNMYISDENNRIRMVNAYGLMTTVAGDGTAGYGGDSMPATAAELYGTIGIAFDSVGNMYIADFLNHRIRKIDTAGIISTSAGSGTAGYTGDGGPATAAELADPYGIAIDRTGNVYFADQGTATVRKIDTLGIITTIAGTDTSGFSGDGGPATAARLYDPSGITLDSIGDIYVADRINSRIRKIDVSGVITTIAGGGTGGGGYGGAATAALLRSPLGIATDRQGNIYIADAINARIRKLDTAGIITTIAGNGTRGFSGDGGPADSAELNDPVAVTVDCLGNVFIADAGNYRVRMIAYDHPPVFTGGHSASITVCWDTDTAINALLKVVDTDTGQTETWSITRPAAHGTAMAGYATTTTGDTLTPAGLTYSPASGYTGNDSFKVRVSDCGFFTDSVTVYVSVVDCGLKVVQATLSNIALTVLPNPNDGSFSLSLTANSNEEVQVTITNMLGEKVYAANTTTNKITTINLHTAAGIYFISASTEDGIYNAKVVVEK